jgi:monovalent cation:H+ antiporter, CPA1 family
MSLLETLAVLVVSAAIAGYVNHRFLHLPQTIGLLMAALLGSIGLLLLDALIPQWGLATSMRSELQRVDFSEVLLHGMLGFLLFAGSLHVNFESLYEARRSVLVLATLGVIISTVLIGAGSWAFLHLLGIAIPFQWCLVFGALISPTDPIAVLGIMKSAGAPKSLEIRVAGESLFNDGIGVIVFTILVGFAAAGQDHGHAAAAPGLVEIILREVVLGIAIGLAFGWLAYRAMCDLEEPHLEVLISMALVLGILFVAHRLHSSSPLACVVAGLFIGNHGRRLGMSEPTRVALDIVWEFIDEALNAILFLLIGLEVVLLSFSGLTIAAGMIMIPMTLLARWISTAIPVSLLGRTHPQPPGTIRVLTWGGLKGGISVALALSLPEFAGREIVLTMTYMVVVFSIVVQGLSVSRLLRAVVPTTMEGERP